jgi:hypothetical protein
LGAIQRCEREAALPQCGRRIAASGGYSCQARVRQGRLGQRLIAELLHHGAEVPFGLGMICVEALRVVEQETPPALSHGCRVLRVGSALGEGFVQRRLEQIVRLRHAPGAVVGVAEQTVPELQVAGEAALGVARVRGLEDRDGIRRAALGGEAGGVQAARPLVAGGRLPVRRNHRQQLREHLLRALALAAEVQQARVRSPDHPVRSRGVRHRSCAPFPRRARRPARPRGTRPVFPACGRGCCSSRL